MHQVSNIMLLMGCFFIIFGTISILISKNFHKRILYASVIDTAGFVTIIIGLIFRTELGFITLKLIFIIILILFINPVITYTLLESQISSEKVLEIEKGESE